MTAHVAPQMRKWTHHPHQQVAEFQPAVLRHVEVLAACVLLRELRRRLFAAVLSDGLLVCHLPRVAHPPHHALVFDAHRSADCEDAHAPLVAQYK